MPKYKIYKRTFEANKYPVGSIGRSTMELSPITSSYMPSYKYAIVGENLSISLKTKKEAVEFINRLTK